MQELGTLDPQWDFALVIKGALEAHGRYVVEVDTRDAQAVVDILWAARQAGRLLGVKVKVDRSPRYGYADSIVTATVRCVSTDGTDRTRTRADSEPPANPCQPTPLASSMIRRHSSVLSGSSGR